MKNPSEATKKSADLTVAKVIQYVKKLIEDQDERVKDIDAIIILNLYAVYGKDSSTLVG